MKLKTERGLRTLVPWPSVRLSPTSPPKSYTAVRQQFIIAAVLSSFIYSATEHRDESGLLYQPQLVHLECLCRFRVFEPIESQRDQCPFLLVITQGGHSHPIPLPEKTPAGIRTDLFSLLESLGEDLPDMTPRAFLRHPTVQAFLTRRFPNIQNPTLSHLHSSLANRSHLHTYIEQAKMIHFPKGTDWKGELPILILRLLLMPQYRCLVSERNTGRGDRTEKPLHPNHS